MMSTGLRSGRASRRGKRGHVTLSSESLHQGFAPPDQVLVFHRVTRTSFGFYPLGVSSIRYSLPEIDQIKRENN